MFIIGAIFFIKNDIANLDVLNSGKLVMMEIIDKPGSCIGTRAKWGMKVKYQDKVFSKQISSSFCEAHTIGDMIEVRYLEGEDRIVLPEENMTLKFISSVILIAFGIYVILLGRKKN